MGTEDGTGYPWEEEAVELDPDLHAYDVTLRDGAQAPGISFTVDDRRDIATALDGIGVRYIEAGYPALGASERERVRTVRDAVSDATVVGLSGCRADEIDHVLDQDLSAVSLFHPGSPVQLAARAGLSVPDAVERAGDAITYAADHGLTVRFAVTDASRTPPDVLRRFVSTAERSGAGLIGVSDTVGALTPAGSRAIVNAVRDETNCPVSVHYHDDLGMATANAYAAVCAGATQVHTTVTGIGENGGNTPLAPLSTALAVHHDFELVRGAGLTSLARLVSDRTGLDLPPTFPAVGDNAFRYVSTARVSGVRDDPATFEAYPPDLVGGTRRISDESGERDGAS